MGLVRFSECILELALRRVAAEHSDKPMYLVLPALRISSRAGIDSSNGVSRSVNNLDGFAHWSLSLTRIDSVQIVKVWSKSEPLDSAFDILLDVGGLVRDTSIPKDVNTTLGSNYLPWSAVCLRFGKMTHTEDLLSNFMLPDEITQELLIDTSLVYYLFTSQSSSHVALHSTYCGIPKGAPQLNSFEKHRLSLVKREIIAQAEVDAHGTKAGRGDFDIGEREFLDHVEYILRVWV